MRRAAADDGGAAAATRRRTRLRQILKDTTDAGQDLMSLADPHAGDGAAEEGDGGVSVTGDHAGGEHRHV